MPHNSSTDLDHGGARGPALHAESASKGPRLGYLLIPLVFLALVVVLAIGLTLNPREVPSPLIGKPVPQFSLPPVKGRVLGLSDKDLKGKVSVVNVFASWCVPCRQEHPLIQQLATVVPVHGLNHKDRPDDAARWLGELGDPYTRTGADLDGRVSIDWGVYGVPETFVIDRDGRIAYKQIGPITPQVLRDTIVPLVNRLGQ